MMAAIPVAYKRTFFLGMNSSLDDCPLAITLLIVYMTVARRASKYGLDLAVPVRGPFRIWLLPGSSTGAFLSQYAALLLEIPKPVCCQKALASECSEEG